MKKFEDKPTTTTVLENETQTEKALSAEEERVLRMRSGAQLEAGEKLGSKLDDVDESHVDEVAARLALMEAEIMAVLNGNPGLRTDRKHRIVEALRDREDD